MSTAPKAWNPFTSPIVKRSWHDRIQVRDSLTHGLPGKCVCWLGWQNSKPDGAYGIVRINGVRTYLHRYVYARYYGVDLKPEDEIGHRCPHRLCFNPLHLRNGK